LNVFSLFGKAAFVAGGSGGIGEAVAWALARHGARVAVAGRTIVKAEPLAERLRAEGHDAFALALDAHSVPDIGRAVDEVAARFGRLDIVVNCIGIQREQALADVTEDAFDDVIALNLKAAMFVAQAAARHQTKGGKQVHLLSVRSQLGLRSRGYSAYCASKGALAMLVRQHACELAPRGITVNGVAPTVVRGEMARHWLDDPATHRQIVERIPLGRVAEPDDVAGAVLFFCAPASDFVTGQVLYVDGGVTASQ
jgi:gluconate 5-dehydrogenase